ncbi:hypothetical protein C2751_00015 [Polynucleobacter paneuropaeus]|uniref:hypothetical protein n=1 Tax=Polynucleobacter paneuropaeus TaxID=2527775 RepID=UPI001BFE04E6|nr:hypothetical protein [Polynucleobacter paneuropaeus]MBT8634017.1 hypothetical protein [Polynucleobacter paneuropaeus]
MSDDLIKKEDLFNVIKHGHKWYDSKIKEGLEKAIAKTHSSISGNHSMRWDSDDKYHYIYDNECYLFILDGKIELRCDRDNVFSSHQTIEYKIKNEDDIELAYERFKSMTMEGEEDE